jgi:hypothetical protein
VPWRWDDGIETIVEGRGRVNPRGV